MSFTIWFVIIAFLTIIQTIIPYLVKRTVVFGVTIPEQYIQHNKLNLYKKRYSIFVLTISLACLIGFTIWTIINHPREGQVAFVGTLIEFSVMIISISFYLYFHARTMQLKKMNKWTENLKQVKMTDLSIRSQDEMLPWYSYILPMIVTVGLMGYTIFQYDLLPNQIPTHWGPNGEPDAFTEKTLFSAIQMLVFLLVMQLMFLGIHIATKKSGIKLSATNLQASRNRQLSLRKYSSWFMFLIVFLITILFSYFQLTTIHPQIIGDQLKLVIPFAFLILILIGTVVFALIVGRTDKGAPVQVNGDITDLDDDSYWKGGLFYFNRNDPSIFVEKRFGVGWTLNFANPLGYLIVLLPIVIILVISFL